MASSASRWSRAAVNRSWAKRSLRILVEPAPVTFAERRSVLQVLQQKGPIEVFTVVPNYPSQFIAVTRTEEMADDLSTSRNLSYAVAAPSKTPDIRYVDLTRPDIIDGTKTAIDPGTSARSADEQGNTQRQFNLHIVNLVDYKHATTMSSSPLHGSWPESYTLRETFISSVLKQSLPHNMAAKGFARWDYDLEVGGEKAERQSPKTKRLQLQRWMPSKMKNPSQKEPE